MDIAEIESNFRTCLSYAKQDWDMWEDGCSWYYDTHDQCVEKAKELKVPVNQFVRVVSRLSPGAPWERNIREAEDLFRLGMFARVTTYKTNKFLGLCMVADKKAHIFNPKKAPKCWNFYGCIMFPSNWKGVVIDRQVLAAGGVRTLRINWGEYKAIARLIKRLSSELRLQPHQVQAILWLYAKRYI